MVDQKSSLFCLSFFFKKLNKTEVKCVKNYQLQLLEIVCGRWEASLFLCYSFLYRRLHLCLFNGVKSCEILPILWFNLSRIWHNCTMGSLFFELEKTTNWPGWWRFNTISIWSSAFSTRRPFFTPKKHKMVT